MSPSSSPLQTSNTSAQVAVVMGSQSDWDTMSHTVDVLTQLDISYLCDIVSAHRTPDKMADFAKSAEANGIQVIIAGAGGAAHLPGMIAAYTTLPVLGVPVESRTLKGIDSLLSIAQMPGGIAVGTLAIGKAGAKNAGLLAASILANHNETIRANLKAFRQAQTDTVLSQELPTVSV